MLKNLRRVLHDRIAAALLGVDPKLIFAGKYQIDLNPEAHTLHGLFTPIFERYLSVELREPSAMRTRIDETLRAATCLNAHNVSLLNLNLAIYSILVMMEAGRGDLDGPVPDDFLALIEREWGYAIKKSGELTPKAPLYEQIGNPTERQAFLMDNGKSAWNTSGDELYFPRAKVLGSLVSLRADSFVRLAARESNGDFIWHWAFGNTLDKHLATASQEMFHLIVAVAQETLVLYGINPGPPPPKEIVLPCPKCDRKLRLKLPPTAMSGRCGACKSSFEIVIEPNRMYLKSLPPSPKASRNDGGIAESLEILGLIGRPAPAEIRSAYRKRMSQYHPDKVSKLGPKIQALAEQESKAINAAMENLSRSGYLD